MEIHNIKGRAMSNEQREKIGWMAVMMLLVSSLFPRPSYSTADGYVVKADSATVYLDWGKTADVKSGDSFTVYREKGELKHPVTGEVLGKAEENVGSGVLDHVEDKFSVGTLIEGKGMVATGDRT